ncbi:MAG: class II fructose-1,6-bisphosphate aldolase [Bacilli bacterium]|jgi:fructose-1,6-bisphosphate aldolase class II|nr:class II fructose-1,6-bisphosphate aldolase [Bacilli bacterium]MCH4210791.1 class II fructose-1,6-bisphosphate aldolase [Bacilli bacterium]MCH4228584.1 class II fructose-1,6-bisphosphate aldolase [Bacilli bacterium]MCH4277888.1 class II fructose-1,6-bisphosphate aldolase [Bacilli bacterium]MCI2055315.1 class II fructose-1,6-bisphosphate aldolase [Bacilli bacterium]
MALVSMKEMLLKAQKEHYAVGQFNINNVEWVGAILDEAELLKTPVILGVSEGAMKYMGGWHTVVGIVKGYMEDKHISVPVALHVDHGSSFEACKAAIDAGFTSVMIDGSKLPLEENIATVKKVVDYAHPRGVSVEAELGRVGGQEDSVVAESMYAIPEECVRMVKETGIDCLAPALGSVHGPYHGEPHLGFKEMETIHEMVALPLVLHGGSGIPDNQLRMAIERGTCKINVNTECQQFWAAIVREVIAKDKDVYDPRKIIGPGKEGIKKTMHDHCVVFGCIGKAE